MSNGDVVLSYTFRKRGNRLELVPDGLSRRESGHAADAMALAMSCPLRQRMGRMQDYPRDFGLFARQVMNAMRKMAAEAKPAEKSILPQPENPIAFDVEGNYLEGNYPYAIEIWMGNPITRCFIKRQGVAGPELAGAGIGVRKHGDPYNWETGARMALKSALRWIEDDDERSSIWATYLSRFPADLRPE